MQIKKTFCLFSLFFAVAIKSILAQSGIDILFNEVKVLHANQKYFDAITEAKRLIFFDTAKIYHFQALKIIADSYKNGAFYSEALKYYTQSELLTTNDDELFLLKIEKIKILILNRSIQAAFNNLNWLEEDKRFITKKSEINYWKGWTYIFNDEWEKAAEEFGKVDSFFNLKNFCEEVHERKYSVTFAKVISYFLPGAGQIYTGEYLSGLMSLGWNVLWSYISIKSILEDRIFDGVMTANFLWFRFYGGNLQNAEKFAVEKNLEITNSALKDLQTNYIGPKP